MSVLMKLKGKVVEGRKDFAKGLMSLTIGVNRKRFHLDGEKQDTAASNFLKGYEKSWSNVHSLLTDCIKRNQESYEKVIYLGDLYEKQSEAVTQLHKELSDIPEIEVSIYSLISQLRLLEQELFTVEDLLLQLEDSSDQLDLMKLRHTQTSLVEDYKFEKHVQMEECKVELARNHMEDVEAYETSIQETLRERQKVFEHTYMKEIQHYKEFGKTILKPTVRKQELDQVDVALEEDFVLDKFWEDEETGS